jgi:hypothetical protein
MSGDVASEIAVSVGLTDVTIQEGPESTKTAIGHVAESVSHECWDASVSGFMRRSLTMPIRKLVPRSTEMILKRHQSLIVDVRSPHVQLCQAMNDSFLNRNPE